MVAPLVGAWIEIQTVFPAHPLSLVAPLVGAWIEIFLKYFLDFMRLSLLSWERGLKFL